MLRLETGTGYWLITHPDHARLAGAFATHWGNEQFATPVPRKHVLHGIHVHDDGWALRDAIPTTTREGKPSAFSQELVGKYSAFEEIDLPAYLAVRERAVDQVQAEDAYAALLVSLHTTNLLTEHADRSTILPAHLPLLDEFLSRQLICQSDLRSRIRADPEIGAEESSDAAIQNNFRLLQACDNLSLLSCVAYMQRSSLLHPLATNDGKSATVAVEAVAPRNFRLSPYPFNEPDLVFEVPARHVEGHRFATGAELQRKFVTAKVQGLTIAVSP